MRHMKAKQYIIEKVKRTTLFVWGKIYKKLYKAKNCMALRARRPPVNNLAMSSSANYTDIYDIVRFFYSILAYIAESKIDKLSI
jgi:hypothetical protein